MTKKLSDKDKKDWQNFLESPEKLYDKDKETLDQQNRIGEKVIDLHGFTLEEANQKVSEFIQDCYDQNVTKINIITGKGLRSKNLNDPYKSSNLGILKYSVPDYIKNNSELMKKIIKIDFEAVNSPSRGNFDIFLKTIK